MKKKSLVLLLALVLVLGVSKVDAQNIISGLSGGNVITSLWEYKNTYMVPFETLDIGATADRIPNIYATNLNTNTITINTASEGALVIDVTDTEAFLVRRDSDAGDLAVFDTTNFDVGFFGEAEFSPTTVASTAVLIDQNFNHISLDIDSEATSATILNIAGANTSGDLFKILNTTEMLALDYLGNLDVAGDVDVGDDILLATAGVIDWNSTDKLTHSANTMTVSGFTTWDMGAVATLDFNSTVAWTVGTGDVDISGASLGVDATEKVLFDGIAGNTYITESSDNELSLIAGGTEGLRIDFNELEVQPLMTLATGPIELEEDSGAVTVINLPVSSTPTDGDEESYTFAIDSNAVLKIYGQADSAGGSDTHSITVSGPMYMLEQADAYADTATYGQLWVNTATPNELYFTTDAGDDREIAYAGGAFHDGFSDFVANEHIDWTSSSTAFSTSGSVGTGTITATGPITSSETGSLGWNTVAVANQACNTTCTYACVFGQNTADMTIVDCADALADVCVCSGAN